MPSVQELGNGKFRIIISNGYDEEGKRNLVSENIKAKSREEAYKLAVIKEDKIRNQPVIKAGKRNMTFAELVADYKENHIPTLAVRTQKRYSDIIEKSLLPAFGRKKIASITEHDITAYKTSLLKDGVRQDGKPGGYAPRTQKHHYRLLHSLFEYAIMPTKALIVSPCNFVEAPKVEKGLPVYYDDVNLLKLLKMIDEEKVDIKYKAFIHISVNDGGRRGENVGIKLKNIDFRNCLIVFETTSNYLPNIGQFEKATKADSVRSVSVPSDTLKIVKKLIAENERIKAKRLAEGKSWVDSGYLFIQSDGRPMHPDTPLYWLTKFTKKHNLQKINIHGLRHTHVTLSYYSGHDLGSISKRIGHADISTTANYYTHLVLRSDKEISNSMGNLVYKKDNSDIIEVNEVELEGCVTQSATR